MNMQQYLNSARHPTESKEAYRVRRCSGNAYVKEKKEGTMFYSLSDHYYVHDKKIKYTPYKKGA